MAQHGNRWTRFIYNHSPWQLQTFMASFYGFKKLLLMRTNVFRKILQSLEQSENLSGEALLQRQNQKLQEIISHTYYHVKYYKDLFRDLNLTPDDFISVQDLRKLPILTKETVRENYHRLISDGYRSKDTRTIHTSGTTGKSLRIELSKSCHLLQEALIWFHRSWAGIRYLDRTATIAGHRLFHADRNQPPFWVNNLFENQVLFSSYHLGSDTLPYYVEKLIKFQPILVWGYASSIYEIALFFLENRIIDVKPRAVFTSSDTLFDFQREVIEKAFQTKVYNYYANAERVANILECEAGNLHVATDYGLIEFLDSKNRPVKFGEEGRMVCTGLTNLAMPLIRYDIGDRAIPIHTPCSCGRKSLLIQKLVGRADDRVVTPTGRRLVRIGGLHKIGSIREAQIVQEKIDLLAVRIVKTKNFTEKDSEQVLSLIRNGVGRSMKIRLDFVESIPRGPGGKFQYIISHVANQKNQKK